jgi:hypothetical protein
VLDFGGEEEEVHHGGESDRHTLWASCAHARAYLYASIIITIIIIIITIIIITTVIITTGLTEHEAQPPIQVR